MIAGSDQYLGAMTVISNADVAYSTRLPTGDNAGSTTVLALGSLDNNGALVAPHAYANVLLDNTN